MKTALYVIVDGMTETDEVCSSLSSAITPNMDWVAAAGEIGFYWPEKEQNAKEPKTDIVIPSFFNIPVSMNPGRVGLELLDLDIKLIPGSYCFSSRISTPDVADSSDWRQFTVVEPDTLLRLESRLNSLANNYGAVCVRSTASNYGENFLFGNCSPSSYKDLIEAINTCLASFSFAPLVREIRQVPSDLHLLENIRQDIVFMGWAKGSLRGAFRFLGAICNPFTRETDSYFNWDKYSSNFTAWAYPLLQQALPEGRTFVLYTKETAFASRRGDQEMKIRGIEFMDLMLGEALRILKGEVVVVLLSDHSCNVGGHDNPSSNTIYAIANVSAGTSLPFDVRRHFCEHAVLEQRVNAQIAQSELVNLISRFRSCTHRQEFK